MKNLSMLLLASLTIFIFTACTVTNKYGPFYGKVVDGETKLPLAGAVVLVAYYTDQYGLAGPVGYFADAQEVLTNKNGEFKVPSIRINKFRMISGWHRYPEVRIFKPGYGCYPLHKYADPKFDYLSLPTNQDVTIELPKLETKEERLKNQSCFPVSVPDEKMRMLIKLNNIERIDLGLEPSHVKEER